MAQGVTWYLGPDWHSSADRDSTITAAQMTCPFSTMENDCTTWRRPAPTSDSPTNTPPSSSSHWLLSSARASTSIQSAISTQPDFEPPTCEGAVADGGELAYPSATNSVNHDFSDYSLAYPEQGRMIDLAHSNDSKSYGALSPATLHLFGFGNSVTGHSKIATDPFHPQFDLLDSQAFTRDSEYRSPYLEEADQIQGSPRLDETDSVPDPSICQGSPMYLAENRTNWAPLATSSTSRDDSLLEAETALRSPRRDSKRTSGPATISLTAKKRCKPTKTPHSAVERKYRVKLSSRMTQLQECTSSLHNKAGAREETTVTGCGSNARPLRHVRMQKGLVLSNAITYIHVLQSETCRLEGQNELLEGQKKHLERRLAVLQMIALDKVAEVVRALSGDCQYGAQVEELSALLANRDATMSQSADIAHKIITSSV